MRNSRTIVVAILGLLCSCVNGNSADNTEEVKQEPFASDPMPARLDSQDLFFPGRRLELFPVHSPTLFISTNSKDQIALLLERDTLNTFKYRIELLRKWKGLPNDYGELQLKKIQADSIYFFAGGNADCQVEITVYNAEKQFKSGKRCVRVKRNCRDDSFDISEDEFYLWHK